MSTVVLPADSGAGCSPWPAGHREAALDALFPWPGGQVEDEGPRLGLCGAGPPKLFGVMEIEGPSSGSEKQT